MKKRLLIIDDKQDIIDVVSEIVLDLFDVVDSANTVDEAQALLTDNVYDLIFLDINLGDRNGAEVLKFLLSSTDNENKNTPFVIISGIITPEFILRHKQRFAGILMKPFDHEQVRKLTEEILGIRKSEEVKNSTEEATGDIPLIKCDLPFPILQLEQRVNKILDQVRASAKLKQLFSKMKIDRTTDNYINSHIGMIINISTAICMEMEWSTDKTLEKFVYAAYLHDMALSSKPELARINTIAALDRQKESLSETDYKLVFEHPNIAANTIEGMTEIPVDVAMIIRQHHELPKGTGFPGKAEHQKIAPLSVVFIVAHDLTEYILANPKWNIEDYNKKTRSQFTGSHFTKILRALSDIK